MKYFLLSLLAFLAVSIAVIVTVWPERAAPTPAAPSTVAPSRPTPPPSITTSPSPSPTSSPLPQAIDQAVPFTIQSPYQIWDAYHEETCEEAAVLMAAYWKNSAKQSLVTIPPAEAEAALHDITDWEIKRFGYWKDTTAAETATILTEKFGVAASVRDDVTEQTIKQALTAHHLVLVPTAGRLLNNPHYTPPGPAYHFLLIRGYTADGQFITNDAGIKEGRDYRFPVETVLNAIHDWTGDPATIESGPKGMIVVD